MALPWVDVKFLLTGINRMNYILSVSLKAGLAFQYSILAFEEYN